MDSLSCVDEKRISWLEKQRISHLGKTVSLDSRRKISESRQGNSHWYFGKQLSVEHRKKIRSVMISIRENFLGELNGNWQGGISKEPYPFEFNQELKGRISERDDFTCQLCSSTEDLMPHHIDYDKSNIDESNLITLCRACNTRVNTNRERWYVFLLGMMKQRYNINER